MIDHKVDLCNSIQDMLDGIAELCQRHKVTGIAIVLNIQSGECYTTHQFGMNEIDLVISSSLMADYAKGLIVDHVAN